jgi:hypothetical protein
MFGHINEYGTLHIWVVSLDIILQDFNVEMSQCCILEESIDRTEPYTS